MKFIRGGSGLGDSIYLRPIVEEFMNLGHKVTALSNYPDVFIGSGANVEPFRRERANVVAHYTDGKTNLETTQFQDMCRRAQISDVALQFAWQVKNRGLVDSIIEKANGRRIVVAHGGRAPMGRIDGFGMELLPEKKAFDAVFDGLNGCFVVSIGAKEGKKYPIRSELDMTGATTVADMMDIVSICDGVVAQCSFAVPLAEVFNKPLLAIWSDRGLRSSNAYVKTITPKKILSKSASRFVMDCWPEQQIEGAARAFLEF